MKIKWLFLLCLSFKGFFLFAQESTISTTHKLGGTPNKSSELIDTLFLRNGWQWTSFPRMERFGNDPFSTEDVLMDLNIYPSKEFTLEDALDIDFKKQWKFLPNPHWEGDLHQVQSTEGYKLNIASIDGPPVVLKLYGARLDPKTDLTIPVAGVQKDLGYFIEESQYPWQAFPSDIYNNILILIQAQYWTMVKDETKGMWKITGKVTPIKYGDMVIVKSNQPCTFQWNDPDESQDDKVIPIPMSFTWKEQAEYTPFYVETDSTSDIVEIGVLVDGECIGATVRQPGDTLVEVDGYFEGLPAGAIVEFETWNMQKSTPIEKDGYVVYNQLTRKKEKRNIYIGEKHEYYDVSFKAGEVYTIPDDISHVTCQPNPFTNETLITMRLNSEQQVWAEVYDISGIKVKTLLKGNLPGGYYEVKWHGDNENGVKVSKGVYFYKIRTGSGTEISDKIILIN